MRNSMICSLVLVTVSLAFLGPVVLTPAAVASAETSVYIEDFATYTAKDYTEDTDWSIWEQESRLEHSYHEGAQQLSPSTARGKDGDSVVVWSDNRDGDSNIYAQWLDAGGNRLWAADVRVSSDSGAASQYDPVVTVCRQSLWDRKGDRYPRDYFLARMGDESWRLQSLFTNGHQMNE